MFRIKSSITQFKSFEQDTVSSGQYPNSSMLPGKINKSFLLKKILVFGHSLLFFGVLS